jgi:lysine 6-dehydrogenase
MDVKGSPVVPRDVLIELVERSLAVGATAEPTPADDHKVLRVDVRGTKGGQVQDWRLESVLDPYPQWGMPCSAFTVGFPAAVTARLLGRGAIERPGAFGGEACIPPETYFAELNRRDIHVTASQRVGY